MSRAPGSSGKGREHRRSKGGKETLQQQRVLTKNVKGKTSPIVEELRPHLPPVAIEAWGGEAGDAARKQKILFRVHRGVER